MRLPRSTPLLAALALAACGSHAPATSTPPVASAPTPAPTPTPWTPRVACGVGPGPGSGAPEDCALTSATYLREVDAAIDRVIERFPHLVDQNNRAGRSSPFVLHIDEFFDRVVQEIAETSRLCVMVDADLEIAVKRDNTSSEQYKLMWSAGYVRRGESSYRATCVPAWF